MNPLNLLGFLCEITQMSPEQCFQKNEEMIEKLEQELQEYTASSCEAMTDKTTRPDSLTEISLLVHILDMLLGCEQNIRRLMRQAAQTKDVKKLDKVALEATSVGAFKVGLLTYRLHLIKSLHQQMMDDYNKTNSAKKAASDPFLNGKADSIGRTPVNGSSCASGLSPCPFCGEYH